MSTTGFLSPYSQITLFDRRNLPSTYKVIDKFELKENQYLVTKIFTIALLVLPGSVFVAGAFYYDLAKNIWHDSSLIKPTPPKPIPAVPPAPPTPPTYLQKISQKVDEFAGNHPRVFYGAIIGSNIALAVGSYYFFRNVTPIINETVTGCLGRAVPSFIPKPTASIPFLMAFPCQMLLEKKVKPVISSSLEKKLPKPIYSLCSKLYFLAKWPSNKVSILSQKLLSGSSYIKMATLTARLPLFFYISSWSMFFDPDIKLCNYFYSGIRSISHVKNGLNLFGKMPGASVISSSFKYISIAVVNLMIIKNSIAVAERLLEDQE
jgi:hypothetical protein